MSGLLVGADPCGRPPLPRLPFARHCEPVTDVTGVAIRAPLAPLKGELSRRVLRKRRD